MSPKLHTLKATVRYYSNIKKRHVRVAAYRTQAGV